MSTCTCEKAVVCEMIGKENIVQVLSFPHGHSPECVVHERVAQRLRDSAPPLLRPVSDFKRGYLSSVPSESDDEDVSMDEEGQVDVKSPLVTAASVQTEDKADISVKAVHAPARNEITPGYRVGQIVVNEAAKRCQPQCEVPSLARFNAHHYISIPLPELSPPSTPRSDGTADSLSTLSPVETTYSVSSRTRASSLAASAAEYPPSSKVSVAEEEDKAPKVILLIKEEEDLKPSPLQWLPKRARHKQRRIPTAGQGFPCLIDDCGLELNGPRERLRHMDTHFAHLSLFKCPGCGDHMARADSLKRHCNTPAKKTCLEAALADAGDVAGGVEWRQFCMVKSGHWFWERDHIHHVRVPPPGDPIVEERAEVRRSFGLDPYN
ncbi:hypothetical protein OBBRIDRAFT_883919 [Obba rivulosa]|uniref:C2H2-type domain-containing protein n=1 Tax=Obba rivulosa TaxID=1052685 RepID=A0A8E2J5Y9_9APHY|nr:hypothetical protein OBBRIDRAFT_883919 [Obba rivulosa]